MRMRRPLIMIVFLLIAGASTDAQPAGALMAQESITIQFTIVPSFQLTWHIAPVDPRVEGVYRLTVESQGARQKDDSRSNRSFLVVDGRNNQPDEPAVVIQSFEGRLNLRTARTVVVMNWPEALSSEAIARLAEDQRDQIISTLHRDRESPAIAAKASLSLPKSASAHRSPELSTPQRPLEGKARSRPWPVGVDRGPISSCSDAQDAARRATASVANNDSRAGRPRSGGAAGRSRSATRVPVMKAADLRQLDHVA